MRKYKYILFDADDTLLDFKKAEHEAFRSTCQAGGIDFSESLCDVYSKINDALWKLLENGGITLDKLKLERYRQLLESLNFPEAERLEKAAQMRDLYMNFLAEQSFVKEYAVDICKTLSAEFQLYIITNGISRIQRSRLSRAPFMEYIEDVFISEEIGVAKPAVGYFDYVLSKIGDADRSKYFVVGDSLSSDIRGAVNSGLDSCWVNWNGMTTELPATYTVSTLQEINELHLY